jgi:lysozyme
MAQRDIPQQAVDLVKNSEGLRDGNPQTTNFDPYLDPVGIWTIGWGHAVVRAGQFVRGATNRPVAEGVFPGGITLEQAEALLRADLGDTGRSVLSVVEVALTDNQFAALLSFTFNLGLGNLHQSTLLRKLNTGDYAGAADQFGLWVMAGGAQQPGLVKRRAAERTLFLQP